MKMNFYQPKIEVDPQNYQVRADGELLVCDPMAELPLAQKYFLFELWLNMLKVYEKYEGEITFDYTLTLPFDLRQKSRFKAELDQGEQVGVQLPRGTMLRGGDLLETEEGKIILVKAADEQKRKSAGEGKSGGE